MFRLTWKGLWAHKLRFALTGLAVVLGVAFMSGTQILTDTMGKTFDGIFEDANQGVDVVVRRSASVESTFDVDVRERVDGATLNRIRAIDGVDVAAGSIEGQAALVGPDGKAQAGTAFGGVMGANWVEDQRLNPFTIAAGHAPRARDEAVLDQATFDSDKHALGDTITVLGKGAPRQLKLVGTATYGDAGGLPGMTLVAVTDTTAQELFAQPGAYDRVLVASDGSVSDGALSSRIATGLGSPGTYEVVTGAADTASSKADLKEDLGFFSTFLLAFAYIALFVGMFIIYNTFSIVVAQRARDMAMLRAIGASRAQVVRSVVAESAAVGVVASAVGLGVGVVTSFGLRALLGAVGLEVPGGSLVIAPSTVITAFVVGTAITVISALWPAVRSSRVRPIAALRDVAIDVSGSSVARTGAGTAVLALGMASFTAGILNIGPALALIGFGTLATIIGVFVLGPVIARPLMGVLGAPVEAISHMTGRLARENVKRNPKRTSATASALMIGVTLVGFITILASSFKASISDTLSESLQADYVVASGSLGNAGLSPDIEADLSALREVATVSPARSTAVRVDGASSEIAAIDTHTIARVADLGVTAGRLADLSGASIAVEDRKAKDDGVRVGDTLTVTFARTGPVDLTVRALIDRPPPGFDGVVYVVGLDTYQANVTDQFDRQVFVKLADGVSSTQAEAALGTVLARWPNGELQDQAAFEKSVASQIDIILNLIYGLLGLAIVIALIGIANTLALSVHERRRELGLLRAVGMTRPQVRSAIRWESVMIALMGTFLGFILAVAASWGIISAIPGDRPIPLAVPPVQLTVIVVLASVAGVLAAVGPARRAAKLDILAAIASH
ncbi:MAG: ABC transporter, fused permease protein [uncultured Acidimicrobiales bacterium]|uniref:ABC transporter, fused permease protein n=1 Tax=uncultured Acidimicrobiales bacterium TaxID=310071 RepID=A0A6J4I1I1_9ACTN|nr:MAG: ABC transporter, fused permease protein [uncultured Acidimicrobiales bacterium]